MKRTNGRGPETSYPAIPANSTLFQLRIPGENATNSTGGLSSGGKAADSLGTGGLRDERVSSLGFLMGAHLPRAPQKLPALNRHGEELQEPVPPKHGGRAESGKAFGQHSPCSLQTPRESHADAHFQRG